MSTRAEEARREMYRQLVVESAERVFARDGYQTARIQDIAAEAGISLTTLYAAFPGKREIFEALHEYRGRAFLARVTAALAESLPARESLSAGVRAFVDFLVEHQDYLRVDLREGRSWAIGDVEASPSFQAGIRRWTALMRRGIEEGVFYDDDPALMATTAFGLMQLQLAARLARSGAADGADAAKLADAIAVQLERSFCRPRRRRQE